ncbi:tetratricopeptide repeat protein [candidate division CSSED10-310 bacterium]|uniref:Tetratricopeptide repeat protein n=1 Tax=candidate division CSSED10-310 bacterium TaxID=2855610 RepID=A0ABV6YWE2_UNCC1
MDTKKSYLSSPSDALIRPVFILCILCFLTCCSGKPFLKSSKKARALELFNQAEFFFHQSEYSSALDLYQQAEHLNPALPTLYHRIGLCYAKTRFYDKARDNFLKELTANPENWDAHIDLGMVYSRMARVEQAEREYRFVLKNDPENYKGYLNLGILLINKLDQVSAGIAQLEQYLKWAPYSKKRSRIEAWIILLKEEFENPDIENSEHKNTPKADPEEHAPVRVENQNVAPGEDEEDQDGEKDTQENNTPEIDVIDH